MLLLDFAEDCGTGLRWIGYDFGLATISKSSTSNTSVSPGLIVWGAPV
jgi:hypothetical protein